MRELEAGGITMSVSGAFPLAAWLVAATAAEAPKAFKIDLAAPAALERFATVGKGVSIREGALEIDGQKSPNSAAFFPEEARPAGISFEFFIEDSGEGAHGCGAILASRSSADYLSVHLDRYHQVILVRSDEEESWGELARNGGLRYAPGAWHRARIASSPVPGAPEERVRVRVEIDGEAVLEKEVSDPGVGRFGFYASDGRARFREVVLEGTPARLDPPWREARRSGEYVVVCGDAGAGGYEAFPDVCLRRSGEMVCVFYAGFGHVSLPGYGPGGKLPPECPKAGRISSVRSVDYGRTWSKPEVVVDSPLDDRDPSIVELPGGELLVTYFSLEAGPGGQEYRFVATSLARSSDGGRSWQEPERLFTEWAVSSPARILSGGRLALPLYYVGGVKSPGKSYGGVSFSSDAGKTWSPPVAVGKEGPLALDAEPDLVELPGGRLLMALRPVMGWSESVDGGKTWSPPARIGFEAHCPYFLRLRSEILVLAHRIPGTSLHYSLDDGRTWSANVKIDTVGGAYPSLCELPEDRFPAGTVFAAYYEEGPGSSIRGRWLRATREGVRRIAPP
jgi:hypothetical protein